MASLSEAEAEAMFAAVAGLRHEIYTRIQVTSTTLETLLQSAEELARGKRAAPYAAAIRSIRAKLADLAGSTTFTEALRLAVLSLCEVYGLSEGSDLGRAAEELIAYYADNSLSLNGRAISFGSFSGVGSPVGDGLIRRVTVDRYGMPLEVMPTGGEIWTAKCKRDQTSPGGIRHEELFHFSSLQPDVDGLIRGSAGIKDLPIRARSARDSLLTNPSFTNGTSGVSISGWDVTAGSVANSAKTTTGSDIYREAPGEETPTALQVSGALTIRQRIDDTGRRFNPAVPHYCALPWKIKSGSGTATLEFHVGAVSKTVSVSAQSGWQLLVIDLDEDSWPSNWYEDDLDVRIVWPGNGTLVLVWDDVQIYEMATLGGQWALPVGGQTPWSAGTTPDTYQATDALSGSEGKNQELFQACTRKSLPSDNTGSETFADP